MQTLYKNDIYTYIHMRTPSSKMTYIHTYICEHHLQKWLQSWLLERSSTCSHTCNTVREHCLAELKTITVLQSWRLFANTVLQSWRLSCIADICEHYLAELTIRLQSWLLERSSTCSHPFSCPSSYAAPSRQDETWNGDLTARQNPEWFKLMFLFKRALEKRPMMIIQDFILHSDRLFRVSSFREWAVPGRLCVIVFAGEGTWQKDSQTLKTNAMQYHDAISWSCTWPHSIYYDCRADFGEIQGQMKFKGGWSTLENFSKVRLLLNVPYQMTVEMTFAKLHSDRTVYGRDWDGNSQKSSCCWMYHTKRLWSWLLRNFISIGSLCISSTCNNR